MKFCTLLLLALLCLFALPLFAQNMVEGGNMEDESAWEILYFNEDSQPDFQFNFTGDSLAFGRGGSLNILQGETGGQLLLWQPIILTAGQTYRATGALTTTDFIAGEGGGTWYQMYISTEMPDEDAADYNPLTDKMFDVGWGWDRPSEFVEGLWEVANVSDAIPSAPYYTAPGTPGEKVEVYFGIKFGQWYPDYAGLGFELLVDEVGLYPVDAAANEGGNMEDESVWEITYYNEDSQPDFQFNFTGDSLSFGRGGSLNILQGETGGQLLLWQPIIVTAGETYRATGALTTTDFIAGEGGGSWYQMYISTEMPDEDAADYNPVVDKMFDVGWGWDRPSEFVEGLWEVSNIGTDVPTAPYYTAPGTPGEKVEVYFGIKFGQWYPDYAGLGFELLVDEVYLWNVAYDDGSSAVAFEADPVVPNELVLEQNYPNPFNPTTNISFTLPETANTTLKVYNTLGVEVATLVNGQMQAGRHTVTLNVADLSSGIYYYTMQQNNFTATKKCVILK